MFSCVNESRGVLAGHCRTALAVLSGTAVSRDVPCNVLRVSSKTPRAGDKTLENNMHTRAVHIKKMRVPYYSMLCSDYVEQL